MDKIGLDEDDRESLMHIMAALRKAKQMQHLISPIVIENEVCFFISFR